jgi:signal transduction histidine kinase
MTMRLQTQVLVPLLLTLGVLGSVAVGAVLQVGEAQALTQAEGDLAARAVRLGADVNASVQERLDSAAVLAFAQAESEFAAAMLQSSPGQHAAVERQVGELFRDASRGTFERVALLGADGAERLAYDRGELATARPAAPIAGPMLAHFRSEPLAAPLIVIERGEGSSRVVVGAAVVGTDGSLAGLVRGELPLEAVAPADERVGPGGEAFLVDAEGRAALGLPARFASTLQSVAAGHGPRVLVDGPVLYAAARAFQTPTSDGKETAWLVVARMPVEAATGPVRQPILLLGAALVGVAGASALAVAATVRRAFRPLERMSKAVSAMGSGPPAGRVEPEGARELHTLAGAFNGMVERLGERESLLHREAETRAQHAKFATLGSLSAGVAHEIKNPLTGMKLQTELLRHHAREALAAARDDEARSLAQAARQMADINDRGIERIEKVVASLSMLARPRPGLQEVELAPVVEASVALSGATLRGRAELALDVPAGLRAIASSDGLGQVLLNLVGNAADAVADRGGFIRIAAAREGDRVTIVVEDNGPGFAPEVMARLGQPFFTTKPDGTGLGLSISMRIVAELGGRLRFENRPKGGARAILDLAAPTEPGPELGPALVPSSVPGAGRSRGEGAEGGRLRPKPPAEPRTAARRALPSRRPRRCCAAGPRRCAPGRRPSSPRT